jgi:hypothetical protein
VLSHSESGFRWRATYIKRSGVPSVLVYYGSSLASFVTYHWWRIRIGRGYCRVHSPTTPAPKTPRICEKPSREDPAPSVHFTQPSHGKFYTTRCTDRQNILSLLGTWGPPPQNTVTGRSSPLVHGAERQVNNEKFKEPDRS